ncbi:MAG: hypothetical protein RL301_320 [Actinomycetota bacterium]
MLAPLSWLKEFVSLPKNISAEKISEIFISLGFEIEGIEETGSDIKGPVVVGKVISIKELTEHKKPIRYVGLDCGEKSLRYVICGARNFEVGNLVVVALPGATLPGNFAISARETYGHTSNGMICSAKELGMGDDHSGIIVISNNGVKIGTDAISILEIKDTVFDISINPDRGYAMSIRGLARELAAGLGVKYLDPALTYKKLKFSTSGKPITAKISAGASGMFLRTINGYRASSPTPLWMQRRIEKCGIRSISLAVDVTNYVMLELGQPLHAFDADVISGTLEIRKAGKVQSFKTLDGQIRTLDPDDLVVADSKKVLALAGTMGGEDSEISSKTNRIALEAVTFDPISVAKNSRRHKLSTEASRRLERGVDPELAEIASARAIKLMMEYGGAKYVGTSKISKSTSKSNKKAITLDPKYVSARIGYSVKSNEIKAKLQTIGCCLSQRSQKFIVEPPSWRPDLRGPADLVEEVARNIGYDKIPSILPPRVTTASLNYEQRRARVIAQSLVAQGYTEVLNFPFVNQDRISQMGYTDGRELSYKVANPMSEDQPWLRPHLLPGLLDAASRNFNRGFKDFAIFELGSIFRKNIDLGREVSPLLGKRPTQKEIAALYKTVPNQLKHLGAVMVGKVAMENWQGEQRTYQWHDAVSAVENLLELLGFSWDLKRSDFAPWHPGRCVEILISNKPVAHAGELHPRVLEIFGLPKGSAAWVINLDALPRSPLVNPNPIQIMPAAVQDLALVVDEKVTAGELTAALRSGAGELLETIELFDRYDKIGGGKISMAFTLTFRASDRTLTSAEIAAAREAATQNAAKLCGAVLRA